MGVKQIWSFKEKAGIYLGVGERPRGVARTPGPLNSNPRGMTPLAIGERWSSTPSTSLVTMTHVTMTVTCTDVSSVFSKSADVNSGIR